MPGAINRVGEFVVRWGESLRWDDVRQRLYFVDCAKKTLHWLEGGEPPLHTLQLDSLPTGLVLTGGRQGKRRMFADHSTLGGAPDGATADSDGGVWSCVLRSGKLARFTATGLDRLLDLPMPNPSDVAFGGPALDRLFVTSIAFDLGEGVAPPPEAGWLLALDHVGSVGRPEFRFSLG